MQETSREEIVDNLQEVKYVGETTAEKLVEELEIRDAEDLVRAAEGDWLRTLEGIGEARQQDILESARQFVDVSPAEEEQEEETESATDSSDATSDEANREVNVKAVERSVRTAASQSQGGESRAATLSASEATQSAPETAASSSKSERTTPRPRSDRFVDRLRCPACGHDNFDRTPNSLTCTACRREYEVRSGITDLAPPDARTGGLSQRVMESSIYARLYEKLARPWLTKIASGRSLDEEKELAGEMLDLNEDSTVLDVACGTGAFTRYFAEQIAAATSGYDDSSLIVGMDISWPMLERGLGYLRRDGLNDRIFLVRGNALRAPLGRSTFRRLHCGWALHLMDEVDEILRSFARVLESDGICVISTFLARGNAVKRAAKKLASYPGFQWFDRRELHDRLERVGLEVVDEEISRESITLKARKS